MACDDGDGGGERVTNGEPRTFMMGFSSLPRELNAAAYQDAIDFAGANGEVLLVQRMVPWEDFLPGSGVREETAQTTAAERDAIDDTDLKLFFAIDPTDGATGRDRISGLPASHTGKRFSDPDVRAAFVAYAEYIALNYKPAYMALGVEMNLYYENDPDDFEQFRTLYEASYDAVKRKSPDTQVTVTFQYEDLQGLLPREDTHFASWQLLRAFADTTDFTAISTYPSFSFRAAGAIPDNYYSQLRAFTDKPIVIAEMGYSSETGQQGVNSGTEADQAFFVARVLEEAEELRMPFVVWFAIWDPAYARDTAFGAFESIGLLRNDNTEKPAWALWRTAAGRPVVGQAE